MGTGYVNGTAHWVRVKWDSTLASNNVFFYTSEDGTTWTQISTLTIPLGQTIYVGMATTSHEPDHLVTAQYRNLSGL